MTEPMGALPVAAALEEVLAGSVPLEAEAVSLRAARGRFTSEAVVGSVDLPGFDNSAMDGFAVCARELDHARGEAPVSLEVEGESRAGSPASRAAGRNRAIRISTGAKLPQGTDAVLPVETVTVEGDRIVVAAAPKTGQNVRFRGEMAQAGAEILGSGTRLDAASIGALATVGRDTVNCHRRPRVALVSSGDELVEPGRKLEEGEIYNSNAPTLEALIDDAGAELETSETVGDDRAQTSEVLSRSLDADLVVICGGVSVGEHDLIKPVLSGLGVEQRFWGLALRPGKPAFFGVRGGTRVLGLPGNPVSAFVVFSLLARPLIRALSGGSQRPRRTAKLAEPVSRLPDRLRVVPCRYADRSRLTDLIPAAQLGSHDLLSLRGAEALAMVASGTGRAEAGEVVETLRIGEE